MNINKLPLVSVVIPTYKRNDKIIKAIESVKKQTYKNIEILIVDDNDPSSIERAQTKEKLQKYIADGSIIYIEHDKNRGGAEARNTGIRKANGEFVAFLDDDDVFHEKKIEKQYNLYLAKKDQNVGIIYCYLKAVDIHNQQIAVYENDIEGNALFESMLECVANTSTWFCPKSALIEVNGFEDTPSKQDTIMIMKLMQAGFSMYRVPEQLVYYYEYMENRISGIGKRAIIGENNARNFARSLYSQLNDEKKAAKVEYNFASELLTLYILNKDVSNAWRELITMLKIDLFSPDTFKGILKFIMLPVYRIHIHRLRKERFG